MKKFIFDENILPKTIKSFDRLYDGKDVYSDLLPHRGVWFYFDRAKLIVFNIFFANEKNAWYGYIDDMYRELVSPAYYLSKCVNEKEAWEVFKYIITEYGIILYD